MNYDYSEIFLYIKIALNTRLLYAHTHTHT